jgi:tRNA pseudouridine38-40 synthase
MNRYAVAIEYDGSAYSGWQTQQSLPTIQGLVESALSGVAAERVEVVCAGRTDAGVHARWQIAHFDTNVTRPLRGWVMGANTELPRDISLTWARPVPLHFHARYSAEARTYRYLILNRPVRSALAEKRAAVIYKPVNHERMAEAAVHLCGHYDFSAFRSSECQSNSPIRRVEQLTVERSGEWVIIEATANAFLHHMMRNIAGLLIEVGKGERPPSWALEVREGLDRTKGAPTAPAEGLYFWDVRYPEAFNLPSGASDRSGPSDPSGASHPSSASHPSGRLVPRSIIIPGLN